MTTDKQQERLGSGKKQVPRDNLDLDVIDALRLGYGVQYGRFKADHPFTKDANEERLAAMKKGKTKPSTPKKPKRPRFKNYTLVCKTCGKKFIAPNNSRSYCSPTCKRMRKFDAKKKEDNV